MKIKGVPIKQGEREFFVGVMTANDLLGIGSVDMFEISHSDGYQRALSESRARSFGRFIDEGGFSPTSFILNVRDGTITSDTEGTINIPESAQIWVVDGQ